MVIAVGLFVLLIHTIGHRPAAIRTFYKPGKDLRCSVFLFSTAMSNLLLHLSEHIRRDNSFVGVLHTIPFLLRLPHLFLVLERDVALLIVNAVTDIGFFFQDTFDLRYRPCVGLLFRRSCIDVSKCAIPLKIQPAGSGNLFIY